MRTSGEKRAEEAQRPMKGGADEEDYRDEEGLDGVDHVENDDCQLREKTFNCKDESSEVHRTQRRELSVSFTGNGRNHIIHGDINHCSSITRSALNAEQPFSHLSEI